MALRAAGAVSRGIASSVKLLLDEMYPPRLAGLLRDRGCDVIAVAESRELIGLEDLDILARAASQARCVVTENIRDFMALAREEEHHGILLVHPRRWPRHRAGLGKLAAALAAVVETGRPSRGEVSWLP